jgi:hypothetical protein
MPTEQRVCELDGHSYTISWRDDGSQPDPQLCPNHANEVETVAHFMAGSYYDDAFIARFDEDGARRRYVADHPDRAAPPPRIYDVTPREEWEEKLDWWWSPDDMPYNCGIARYKDGSFAVEDPGEGVGDDATLEDMRRLYERLKLIFEPDS